MVSLNRSSESRESSAFSHLVKDKKDIFVFPKEVKVSDDSRLLVERGILTREEFSEMVKVMNPEMKSKRK